MPHCQQNIEPDEMKSLTSPKAPWSWNNKLKLQGFIALLSTQGKVFVKLPFTIKINYRKKKKSIKALHNGQYLPSLYSGANKFPLSSLFLPPPPDALLTKWAAIYTDTPPPSHGQTQTTQVIKHFPIWLDHQYKYLIPIKIENLNSSKHLAHTSTTHN